MSGRSNARNAFAGKVAIVSGAGSGIGAALCGSLVQRHAVVIAADIALDRVTHVCDSLPSGTVFPVQLDVRDPVAFSEVFAAAQRAHGSVDFVFNNAGILSVGEIRDLELESWRKIIETNLFGVINGSVVAYKHMAGRRSGHIVNVASAAALIPSPLYAPYAASKAAVLALSTALRLEAKEFGVRVSIVCPGNIATGIFDSSEIVNASRKDVFKETALRNISPGAAAETILRGVERGSPFIVFPLSVRAMWWLVRLRSTSLDALLSEVVRRFRLSRRA